jgi:dTDP-4-dehydrorhamnose reductase
MSESKALIIGAGGQVGACLLRAMGSRHCIPTSRRRVSDPAWLQLDLADLTSAEVTERQLDGREVGSIFCAGGMTHVDGCEAQEELAMQINCRGPAMLAIFARRRNVPFLYYSTEYVFDGEGGPYAEQDAPHPINVYGLSKWRGEQDVLAVNPEALIVRTTVVYGYDRERKNFLYGLKSNLLAGKPMRVPADQFSTPTYNVDLATASTSLVANRKSGIFNVTGPELYSRVELAWAAAKLLHLDARLIQPVSTRELAQAARRPLRAGLKTAKLLTELPELTMSPLEAGIANWEAAERLQPS